MKSLLLNRQLFCTVPRAFALYRNDNVEQSFSNIPEGNKQKISAIAKVIESLNNKQLQYLLLLQNERQMQNNKTVLQNKIVSLEDSVTGIQYLYQKRWMKEVWKQSHLLSTIVTAQIDDEQVEQQEVVKEIYDIELTSVDPAQKIKVIKVLRQLLSLGLKEAKDIVDKAPMVMKKCKKAEGEQIKQSLSKSGCVVTLK